MIADTSLQRFSGPWVRRSQLRDYGLLIIGLCVATIVTTWPHRASVHHSRRQSHRSALQHVASRLVCTRDSEREHLLHANVFYPEPFTYLLSDATFLQSALAAPGIWSGVALPTVYNTLILIGIVSSGVAMYWLATSLGIRRSASVLAAAVFSLAPYRIEGITIWSCSGSLQRWCGPSAPSIVCCTCRSGDSGGILGIAVWLQFLSSVYYTVFLLPILLLLVVISFRTLPELRRTFHVGLLAATLSATLTLPVARLYMDQKTRVGQRSIGEIVTYSATPRSYLASPGENTIYGATADWLGSGEKRSFPGALALSMAVLGLFSKRRRIKVAAIAVVLLALDLSFGLNGVTYPLLLKWWAVLDGLRAPAQIWRIRARWHRDPGCTWLRAPD